MKFVVKYNEVFLHYFIKTCFGALIYVMIIPIFTSQLEKSREATDAANIRAAYAEATTDALQSNDGTGSATSVAMTQTTAGFATMDDTKIAGVSLSSDTFKDVVKGKTVTVNVAANGSVTFTVN